MEPVLTLDQAKTLAETLPNVRVTEQSIKDKIEKVEYYTVNETGTLCMIQMKNGLLALSTGRPGPIGIHFSADDGKTWSERTVVADFPGTTDARVPNHKQLSTCYTGMVEVEPGRLLVVYDHLPNVAGWGMNPADKPGAVNTIYGTFVKVTR